MGPAQPKQVSVSGGGGSCEESTIRGPLPIMTGRHGDDLPDTVVTFLFLIFGDLALKLRASLQHKKLCQCYFVNAFVHTLE